MSRKDLANREPVNCAVDKELNQKLIQLSKETGVPKSKLLDKAIEIYSNGNQAKFSKFSHIKESTIKTWRSRETVPEDKKLLLNVLLSKYELIQENKQYKEYFRLQDELTVKSQNKENNE